MLHCSTDVSNIYLMGYKHQQR